MVAEFFLYMFSIVLLAMAAVSIVFADGKEKPFALWCILVAIISILLGMGHRL